MGEPVYGQPTFLGVVEANLDGTLYDFAVDGHPGVSLSLESLVNDLRSTTGEHGAGGVVYLCVPVARVDEGKITSRLGNHTALLAAVAAVRELIP